MTGTRVRRTALWVTMVLLAGAAGACSGATSVDRPIDTVAGDGGEDAMQLTSSAFGADEQIPIQYTCDGADVSPPLTISGIPAEAASLVLIMDDPDAPGGTWDHWIAVDIPVVEDIPENIGPLGTGGRNSWGNSGYGGPCPPRGVHRYVFTVYALDTVLGVPPGYNKGAVLAAIEGHVLAEASLIGVYGR